MSAAFLWIYIPFLTGAVLMLFPNNKRFTRITSLILTGFLSLVALRIPVNSMIVFNRRSLIFSASTRVFGRMITIDRADQTIVAFFYAFAFIWIFGSIFTNIYRYFIQITLMGTALLIGVIAVRPFIYGVFLVMIIALLFLPMLRDIQRHNENAIFRFLLYQLMGVICMAVSGQLTGTVDINPQDSYLLKRTVILIFSGLSLWLAMFPFFSWIASMMEKGCPFVTGFVVSLLQFSSLFILLQFLNDYLWLRTYAPLFRGLRMAGILMLVAGAVLAVYQTNLQRMMAFIITAENGVSILLLGANSRESINTFLSGLFIHSIVWLIWATSVKFIGSDYDLSLDHMRGLAHRHPVVCSALLLSHFTVSGLPLLAGFDLRMSLFSACFAHSGLVGWTACIASSVLLFTGIRLLFIFLEPLPENDSPIPYPDEHTRYETIMRRVLLITLMVLLILISFVPGVMEIFVSGIRTQYALIFG
ncbi:MAG: hypothetical protein IKP86_00535 [Anaerolineaceae bacterium]|nr:hypothetical protein [Anaerolineaceae bacterium]